MKALDNRNATARKRADPNQPYNKLVITTEKACPQCNKSLRLVLGDPFADYECDYRWWSSGWATTEYKYRNKVATINSNGGTNE